MHEKLLNFFKSLQSAENIILNDLKEFYLVSESFEPQVSALNIKEAIRRTKNEEVKENDPLLQHSAEILVKEAEKKRQNIKNF